MEIEVLQEIGFTAGESKVYLALLETGPANAGIIVNNSKLPNSVIHLCLNTLIKKGFVSYIKKGKRRIYSAVHPKRLVDFVEQKKTKIKELLPKLLIKKKAAEEKPIAEVYEGTKGVMTLLDVLLEDIKKGDEYYFFSFENPIIDKKMKNIFLQHERKRQEKGAIVKCIAPAELKTLFKGTKINVRYVDFPILNSLTIINDKLMILDWEKEPTGFLIKSKKVAKKYKEFFQHMWKIADNNHL